MSDLGETFKAWNEEKRTKKQNNAKSSEALLMHKGVPFCVLNQSNHHLLVAERFDFWPSTGRWMDRENKNNKGRGVRSLLKNLLGEGE